MNRLTKPVIVRMIVPVIRGLLCRNNCIKNRPKEVIDKYMHEQTLTEQNGGAIVDVLKPSNMIGIRKGYKNGSIDLFR